MVRDVETLSKGWPWALLYSPSGGIEYTVIRSFIAHNSHMLMKVVEVSLSFFLFCRPSSRWALASSMEICFISASCGGPPWGCCLTSD